MSESNQEIKVGVEVLNKPSYYPDRIFAFVKPDWVGSNGKSHTVLKDTNPVKLVRQVASYDSGDEDEDDIAPLLIAKYEFVGFIQAKVELAEVKVKDE